MGLISIDQPQIGRADTTEDVKIQNNFTAIAAAINGGLDLTNLTPATAALIAAGGGGGTPTGPASGDLTGTYPNPSVSKVNGVSVTGTPSAGYVLTGTSGSSASWKGGLLPIYGGSHSIAWGTGSFYGSGNYYQGVTVSHGLPATPAAVFLSGIAWAGITYEYQAPDASTIYAQCVGMLVSGGVVDSSNFSSGTLYKFFWAAIS